MFDKIIFNKSPLKKSITKWCWSSLRFRCHLDPAVFNSEGTFWCDLSLGDFGIQLIFSAPEPPYKYIFLYHKQDSQHRDIFSPTIFHWWAFLSLTFLCVLRTEQCEWLNEVLCSFISDEFLPSRHIHFRNEKTVCARAYLRTFLLGRISAKH